MAIQESDLFWCRPDTKNST